MGPGLFEPSWYAVYTKANHEKHVAQQLRQRSIENLLPLYVTVRRWKDRRVRLQVPLFAGYVFVRFVIRDRLQVLQIPSVVHLVSFAGQPVPLPEEDIHAIQNCLSHGNKVEPHPYLQIGRRTRLKSGPLQGLEGVVLRRKNRTRFILSLDLIMRSVEVEVDDLDLAPAG
jgi:transcription antitermination factor NusG